MGLFKMSLGGVCFGDYPKKFRSIPFYWVETTGKDLIQLSSHPRI